MHLIQKKMKRLPMKPLIVNDKGLGKGGVVYNLLRGIDVKVIVMAGHGPPKAPEVQQFVKNYTNAKIYCFEPDSRNWKELSRKYNGTNVSMFPYALGESYGTVDFFEASEFGASSLFQWKKSGNQSRKVQMVNLDGFAEQYKLNRINHLFLDIQGAEHLAFAGAKDLLKRQAIDVIVGEAVIDDMYGTPDSFYESYTILKDSGYTFVGVYGPSQYPAGRVASFDYIFAIPGLVQ